MRAATAVRRVVEGIVLFVLSFVLIVAVALWILSATPWGHEKIRGLALSMLQGMVHGQVTMGRLSGNLLTGITVHDFAIRDSSGAPFLAADELSARYALGPLLRKKIYLSDVTVVRPVIVLDRPPNGIWNYQRIFPRSAPKPGPQPPGWGSWLRFTNVAVTEGHLIVRTPWAPSGKVPAAARDSIVRDALHGRSRLMIVPAPGGYQKVVELQHIDTKLPLLQLADPAFRYRVAQVATLQMLALPFRPPAADVRDMRGRFLFDNDSLFWKGVDAALPASRISGDGAYAFSTADMWLRLHGAPAALADLRWLYPRLPSRGEGRLDFDLTWVGEIQDYHAYHADVVSGPTHITGSFGIALSDTFAIHDTNLRFANVDTRLLEQLIAGFRSPRRGSFTGHAIVSGGKHALSMDGAVSYADRTAGTSDITAHGVLGFGDGVRARRFFVDMHPVQVALARAAMPTLPLGGTLRGTAYLDGWTKRELSTVADVELVDRGTRSALNGRATLRLDGTKWFDANVNAHPVSLVEVGRFVPSVGLQGYAAGPLHVTGTLADLRLDTDLRLAGGGRLVAAGTLGLSGPTKRYDLAVGMHVFNAHAVLAKAPTTSVTLRATARGAGTNPATMQAAFAADLRASRYDSLAIDSGAVRVAIANGMADVARLRLSGAKTLVTAQGTFGLAAGRSGTLAYHVAIDSLGTLDRLLPHTGPDTGFVRPRPGRFARALRRHRADSARVASALAIERLATGRRMPRIPLDTPKAVPVTVSGSLYAAGVLRGGLQNFDLRGRLSGDNLNVHGYTAYRLRSEYAWTGARTPTSTIALGVHADSVTAAGFAFDTLDGRLSKSGPAGRIELLVRQGSQRDYQAMGNYTLEPAENEVRVSSLMLRFDTTRWVAPHPADVRWGTSGIRVEDFELRNGSTGRVYANGLLPTKGLANFDLAVENFRIENIADLLQSDVPMRGVLTLDGAMAGTLSAPTFRGAFAVAQATYDSTPVPDLHGTFGYAAELLSGHVDALRNGGAPMAVLDARLPLDLALQNVTGPRVLDAPASADLVADSLPLELIPQFTAAVSDVHGLAAGRIALRGTLRRPALAGGMLIRRGHVKLNWLGTSIADIAGTVRMAHDTVYVDSITGDSRGEIRVRGTVAVGNFRQPTMNLFLVTHGAEVINNYRGRLRADAGLALSGPFDHAYLSGQVNVLGGVIYAPEPTGRHIISAGDPGLFAVVDTSTAATRELFQAPSPLMQNLRMEIAIGVARNTWVRNQEANVEIHTDYPVRVRMDTGQLALTGAVATDRGEYNFMSKRFQIARGSATFTGSAELDPLLQVTGEYQVQVANSPALTIKVLVGGTLRHPSLSLDSDAQPPKTQSELLSLLAFGRATSALMQPEGSSIASVGTPGDLVGVGAALAMKRLEGVALGVAIQQLQTEAGRATGADFFDITPGATPEVTQIVGGGNLSSFLADTRVEAGKYLNPRTFLGVQEQIQRPGLRLEYRTPAGFRYDLSFEPRVILLDPTLSGQPWRATQQVGAFVIHEWRF